ncbi:MAG: spore cortex biosynthesis protein YabQ [Clostridia bacterium]|nr:spore cortex biosynthesis protein YabQ [Clostridia bacterium]
MLSQYQIFIVFIIIGIFLSFIYDIFRIIRRVFKTQDLITYLEDVSFWLISRHNSIIFNI